MFTASRQGAFAPADPTLARLLGSRGLALPRDADDPAGAMACLRDAVAPGSYIAISHIGTDFFPDKATLAEAVAVYEWASEPI